MASFQKEDILNRLDKFLKELERVEDQLYSGDLYRIEGAAIDLLLYVRHCRTQSEKLSQRQTQ